MIKKKKNLTAIKNKVSVLIRREWKLNSLKSNLCFACLIFVLIIVVGLLKWPHKNINYRNADATWHVLLTMQCYDETPVSVHKFLPIVSLGEERDKGISWGATIPDKYGNYYYTSFSPMGFVVPYFFLKLFHLDFTEAGLYIFNLFLLFLSCIIIVRLFKELWKNCLNPVVMFGIILIYVLSPEIMHGMGVTYWHQSLMQVFLPLQILLYYKHIQGDGRRYSVLFLIMCVINPYTEWSGYVANGGFFIAEIIRCHKKPLKEYLSSVFIVLSTILSLGLFIIHYLSVVNAGKFFGVLKYRFRARNIAKNVPWKVLLRGYWSSFAAIFIIFLIFVCVYIYSDRRKKIKKNEWLILMVSFFPVFENIIMKEHAVSYTYDRMKLVLPFILIIYWCIHNSGTRRSVTTLAIIACISIAFATRYKNYYGYIWKIDYGGGNEKVAEYINKNFDDNVMGSISPVRGYLNMTFGRGCFERITDINELESYASSNKCRYMVMLQPSWTDGKDDWNKYKFNAEIHDRENGRIISIINTDEDILVKEGKLSDFDLDLMDISIFSIPDESHSKKQGAK